MKKTIGHLKLEKTGDNRFEAISRHTGSTLLSDTTMENLEARVCHFFEEVYLNEEIKFEPKKYIQNEK